MALLFSMHGINSAEADVLESTLDTAEASLVGSEPKVSAPPSESSTASLARYQILELSLIIVDPGLQVRAGGVDETIAREYGQALKEGDRLPPIVVYGPDDNGRYWLADGFHRVSGAQIERLPQVDAEIRPGGRREALLHAVGSNALHGLRRTQADKRRAVLTLLEDPEWSNWSDRAIAAKARVSQPFVSALRRKSPGADNVITVGTADGWRDKNGNLFDRRTRDDTNRAQAKGFPPPARVTDNVISTSAFACSQPNPTEPACAPVRARDPYAELERFLAGWLPTVPEDRRHMVSVQLRNKADNIDPEFQERILGQIIEDQKRRRKPTRPKIKKAAA